MTEHVLVVHRWPDDRARYERSLDHLLVDVSYIVPPAAAAWVPSAAAAVEVVGRTDDLAALATAAGRLCQRFGTPSRIVALAEADLDAAAELRVLLGCPGETPSNQAVFRDRAAMLTTVAAAGIRTPRFAVVQQGSDVLRFLAHEQGPVTLQPRFGSSAGELALIETPADAERLGGRFAEQLLAQAYLPAPRFHLDGSWDGARLLDWRAARYLDQPADLLAGRPLGSVEVDDAELLAHLAAFATATMTALCRRPAVLHLEAAVRAASGAMPEVSFAGAGCWLGGAEIPWLWREVHGIDLAAAAIAVQLGRPLPAPGASAPEPAPTGRAEIGGWLLVPTPVPPPCQVERVDFEPGELAPYAALLPAVGDRIPEGERVGARLRFRGPTTAVVERAVRAAADRLRLSCSPN